MAATARPCVHSSVRAQLMAIFIGAIAVAGARRPHPHAHVLAAAQEFDGLSGCAENTETVDQAAILGPLGNPLGCWLNETDARAACSNRGTCISVSSMIDRSRWSRVDSNLTCFWLLFTEQITKTYPAQAARGLCECDGQFDGAQCASCKIGFTGADCSETRTSVRKSVTKLTDTELSAFNETPSRFGYDMEWIHSTTTKSDNDTSMFKDAAYNTTFCSAGKGLLRRYALVGEAVADAHQSRWLLPWHRLYLASAETRVTAEGVLSGMAFWDLSAEPSAIRDTFYRVHPTLPETSSCPKLLFPNEYAHAALKAAKDPSVPFRTFNDDYVQKLHIHAHSWMCAVRAPRPLMHRCHCAIGRAL